MIQRHSYHLVDPSPWPLLSSICSINMTLCFCLFFHGIEDDGMFVFFSIFCLVNAMFNWWGDVVRESTFLGHHTEYVQVGLKIGMILFIISEVMFFFAFFWGFFHSSLVPSVELGSIWPPVGIYILDTWHVPFLNTLLLLLSGSYITEAHYQLECRWIFESLSSLHMTILLALMFTVMQYVEYVESMFNISDGIYGSTFFLTTGFHGLHVLIGTTFIYICFNRMTDCEFSFMHYVGLELAAWYWHFVDVVWLFLFVFIYWWGSL